VTRSDRKWRCRAPILSGRFEIQFKPRMHFGAREMYFSPWNLNTRLEMQFGDPNTFRVLEIDFESPKYISSDPNTFRGRPK